MYLRIHTDRGKVIMKTLRAYLNEKGQDLIEYTLILAFCAVLVTSLTSDAFHRTIKAVFDNGVFNDVTLYVSGGDYKDALTALGGSSRRELISLNYDYGKYYRVEGADQVDNNLRIAADRAALSNIGEFFLGMDKETLSLYLFNKMENDKYFTQGSYGQEILLIDYTDNIDVEDNYDSYSNTYRTANKHSTTNITLKKERTFNADEVIHWMQGDYGTITGYNEKGRPIIKYNDEFNFDSNTRYFFSNEMIDPDMSLSGGTLKRNIRVNYELDSNGIVVAVRVRAQRNGEDIDSLIVEVRQPQSQTTTSP